jgi:hypothetical protein
MAAPVLRGFRLGFGHHSCITSSDGAAASIFNSYRDIPRLPATTCSTTQAGSPTASEAGMASKDDAQRSRVVLASQRSRRGIWNRRERGSPGGVSRARDVGRQLTVQAEMGMDDHLTFGMTFTFSGRALARRVRYDDQSKRTTKTSGTSNPASTRLRNRGHFDDENLQTRADPQPVWRKGPRSPRLRRQQACDAWRDRISGTPSMRMRWRVVCSLSSGPQWPG